MRDQLNKIKDQADKELSNVQSIQDLEALGLNI